jgi:hypothetical protein
MDARSATGSLILARYKLPTGFQDGSRMWINGKFLKANGHSVQEHGGFELKAAALDAERRRSLKHGSASRPLMPTPSVIRRGTHSTSCWLTRS